MVLSLTGSEAGSAREARSCCASAGGERGISEVMVMWGWKRGTGAGKRGGREVLMRCCRIAVRGCEGGGMSQREFPGIFVVWSGSGVGYRMVGDGAGMVERAGAEQAMTSAGRLL